LPHGIVVNQGAIISQRQVHSPQRLVPFKGHRQIRLPFGNKRRVDIPAHSDPGLDDPAPLGQAVGINPFDRQAGMISGPENDFT